MGDGRGRKEERERENDAIIFSLKFKNNNAEELTNMREKNEIFQRSQTGQSLSTKRGV